MEPLRIIRAVLPAVSLIFLVSCTATQGSFCDLAKPIRMTPAQIDTLTDAQVAEYLGHNRRGERECGWRP